MRAAGFLLACLPGGSSKDDIGTADCFFLALFYFLNQIFLGDGRYRAGGGEP